MFGKKCAKRDKVIFILNSLFNISICTFIWSISFFSQKERKKKKLFKRCNSILQFFAQYFLDSSTKGDTFVYLISVYIISVLDLRILSIHAVDINFFAVGINLDKFFVSEKNRF